MALYEKITYTETTPRIIEQWNNLKRLLLEYHKDDLLIYEIKPVDAERFKSDFFGLLKHSFKINQELWYPHLILNGLLSPLDFKETMPTLTSMRADVLMSYLDYIEL